MRIWLLLIASTVGMLLGCQGVEVDSIESPIIGGQTNTADPGVVLLVASTGQSQAYCTAEIVSPHVLMTAAHCVSPNEVGSGATFQVFLGADVNGSQANQANLWLDVSETHYDTTFNSNRLGSGHDVGVAILAKPTTVTPITMNHTALTQTQVGQPLRLVGYGISSGNDQSGQTAGTKRVVSTPLSDFDSLFVDFGTASKGTCEGDSGGPAFMTIGGAEVIVGITSFGPSGCSGGSTDTRVDTRGAPFIDPYIQQFDPGWTAGGGTTGSTTGSGGTTGATTGSGGTTGTTGSGGTTTGSGGTTGTTGSGGTTTGSGGTTTGSGGTTTGSGGTTTGSGGTTGTTGASGGSTSGGNTVCGPNSCPKDYTCVVAGGAAQCILAPKPSVAPTSSDGGGCSVGGRATASPIGLMLFALLFLVRSKRRET